MSYINGNKTFSIGVAISPQLHNRCILCHGYCRSFYFCFILDGSLSLTSPSLDSLRCVSCTLDAKWFISSLSLSLSVWFFPHTHRLLRLWGGVGLSSSPPRAVTLQWVMDGGVRRAAAPRKHSCSACYYLSVREHTLLFPQWPTLHLLYSSAFALTSTYQTLRCPDWKHRSHPGSVKVRIHPIKYREAVNSIKLRPRTACRQRGYCVSRTFPNEDRCN